VQHNHNYAYLVQYKLVCTVTTVNFKLFPPYIGSLQDVASVAITCALVVLRVLSQAGTKNLVLKSNLFLRLIHYCVVWVLAGVYST